MPRGDEIESDDQRRRRRLSRDDDERDERRDDRRERDDDDARDDSRRTVRKKQRSGLVIAVGIISIVLGTLNLGCGVCVSFGGVCFTGFAPIMQKQLAKVGAQGDPKLAQAAKELERVQPAGWLMIALGIFNILCGTGLILGGIGVLLRSNIARFLTLALALILVLGRIADLATTFFMGLLDGQGAATSIGGMLFGIAFAVFAGIVLLNPNNAKSFTRM
jgi:hypothetical protein